MVPIQAKLTGTSSRRPEGSVLCFPVPLLSWDTKWVLKTHPSPTKCCCLCLSLSSLCHKKHRSTFIFCITATPSLLEQSRKVRCWVEHGKKSRAKWLENIQEDTPCENEESTRAFALSLFVVCFFFLHFFFRKDEKSKSPVSSWVEKGDTNHPIPIHVHAWLFTQSSIQHGGEVEKAPSLLTSRISAGHVGKGLNYHTLHSPNSPLFLNLLSSSLRKNKQVNKTILIGLQCAWLWHKELLEFSAFFTRQENVFTLTSGDNKPFSALSSLRSRPPLNIHPSASFWNMCPFKCVSAVFLISPQRLIYLMRI